MPCNHRESESVPVQSQADVVVVPTPWPAYGQMTDDDLRAVWAYLRSVPALVNHVPEGMPAEPPAPAP